MTSFTLRHALSSPGANSDADAVALAQNSIDAWSKSPSHTLGAVDSNEDLDHLAAVLEFFGDVSAACTPGDGRGESPADRLTIGRYEILEERGRGGFGIVLRAFDPLLDREVALKLPRPDKVFAGHAPEEFVREAQTAARLTHPSIVRVYEVRQLGPIWYIASAYCEGPTLAAWLDEQSCPTPPEFAARLIADVADAVHYAHTRGVLHLDLKPDNILLERPSDAPENLRPLVTDFGLASRRESEAATSPTRIAGTLAYMAPEQSSGDTARVGVMTDVYALGAILHDVLNGLSNNASLPDRHTSLSNTPYDLVAICRRSMAEDPAERYDSARDFADELRRYLHGECVRARPIVWPRRAVRWSRRRPAIAALIACLAVTVVTSLGVIVQLWQGAEANLTQLRSEKLVHAKTAERMQTSLLNLTWFTHEKRLLQGRLDARSDAELLLLQDFHREVRGWSQNTADTGSLAAAVRAAGHSLALIDALTKHSRSRVDEEFTAGLAAWQGVIAQQPSESRWHRALALHVFTYAAHTQLPEWLWWRSPRNGITTIDPAITAIIEEPYAHLLVEFTGQHSRFCSPDSAYDMLGSAVAVLEERRGLPDPDGVRRRTLLTAYNRMSEAARLISRSELSRDALAKAEALVAAAPPAVDCPPLLALAIGDTHYIRSRVMKREGDQRGALPLLKLATSYFERAVREFPDETAVRMSLASVLYRSADVHASLREQEPAITQYRAAIAVLDSGIARAPAHRNFIKRRAAMELALAECLLVAGVVGEAQISLEAAAQNYTSIGLSNQDSRTVWMQSIRCWQMLGKLYGDQGRTVDAVSAYEKSLELLEDVKPRLGTRPQFAEYSTRSSDALAKLSLQQPEPPGTK